MTQRRARRHGHSFQQAQSDDNRKALRAQVEEATQMGLFGAPTFVVGKELFWGNDRLEDALDWAQHHPAV